jgi:hypothetical protein
VANPEHPAAKAGRLVRAVGLGVARELDKLADAPPRERPKPEPAPPPVKTGGIVGTAAFYVFLGGVLAFLLALLKADDVVGGTAQTVIRLVLAGILLFAALVLISNWQLASDRVGQRLLGRVWGPRGAANRRERFFARRVRDVLILVGIAFLAAGVFEFLKATVGA